MKIILTGATGFVGSETLSQLLADPRVTQVTCLVRRPLVRTDSKLAVIIHEDFMKYAEQLLARLADHSACIWTLGGKISDLGAGQEFERITHGFTLAFAGALAARIDAPFSFCYLSGMGADPSERSWLPWEKENRCLKGRTEKDLHLLHNEHPDFSAHCFRPGGILPRRSNALLRLAAAPLSIGVVELAKALICGAVDARLHGRYQTLSNGRIKELARKGPRD
jgi:nucleoside-diphosphate-sugar epimerase